jgi:NAD(P)-dependent dehydrogenase (short-subunit alcohol dehydrogenase family)
MSADEPPTPAREQPLAVVGGGAGSLGRIIVERLAAASMRVVALDFDADRIARARNGANADRVDWKVVDICDRDAVVRAYGEIGDLGVPSVLVNSAGLGPAYEGAAELEPAAVLRVMTVNVLGILNCCHAAVPFMRSLGWGRIVNISSVAAHGGWRGRGEYAASKAALESFSASLAVELGPVGITVNCVAPGHMRTEMTDAAAIPWEPIISRTALGRLVTPHEVAEAVAFLVGEGAGGITGSVLTVDAGYSANQLAAGPPFG